ncbi:RRP15-like protein [Amphiura filiformis]|uniref:RRP15-like protein n=1 Tax=Amphiura filiformis TaxID=82378 RepID=UPI003B20DDF7
MAASTKHADDENVAMLDEGTGKKLSRKRKQPYIKVAYDSGSDADAESGDDDDEILVKRGKQIKQRTRVTASDDNSSASSDEDDDDDNDDESEQVEAGAGWADAMARILRNEAPEEVVVLSKSKEYAKKKETEQQQHLELKKEKEDHKQWENLYRVKPKVTEREHERSLQRTATRGVVQLFNAVKKQQKFLEDKLKEATSETKRLEIEASISKGDFLDLLKGSKNKTKDRRESRHLSKKTDTGKPDEKDKPMWSVLREDFMMGAKMKDWDKQQEQDKTKQSKR